MVTLSLNLVAAISWIHDRDIGLGRRGGGGGVGVQHYSGILV